MEALKDQLLSNGFDSDHVFLMNNNATDNRNTPFKSNVEKQLNVVLGQAERDDMIVVAFSGHGLYLGGNERYLCPVEADPDNVDTLIPLADIYNNLKECRASLKLLIVDACRNDPRPPGRKSATAKQDLLKLAEGFKNAPQGIVLLSSCTEGEISMESDEFGRGVFMHFLLQGLSGSADENRNMVVTLGEATRYASDKTKTYVARQYVELQRPFLTASSDISVLDYPLTQSRRPQIFTNTIGMRLVPIEAGQFLMGSHESAAAVASTFAAFDAKEEYYVDEHPQHRVRISRPFYVGMHEVTVGQFHAFVIAEDYETDAEKDGEGGWGWNATESEFEGLKPQYTWHNVGWPQTDAHPVVNVSWNDADAFCRWLSRKEGRKYRLPSEAEWEYCCRAGSSGRYSYGEDPDGLALVANVADATAKAKFGAGWKTISAADGFEFSAPVGRFRGNAFGLFDMHGNVWEWCQDWHDEKYYQVSPESDPPGPESGSFRVLRGGSWYYDPSCVRCAYRIRSTPTRRDNDIGFRVVCESE
jgi:formylglycine-generating enzyme required for sulfatase activity